MSHRSPEKILAWRATLAAWTQSGQSINAFCRERKLTRSNFDRWRRILAVEPRESPQASAFVPVRVIPDPVVEVILPSGVRLRVPLGADVQQVARLAHALGAEAC